MLAEAPVKDPSPPQAKGPSAAASPRQMDLTVGDCPCEPPGPSPTDGVSQWEHGHTSIPIKVWPALVMTFRCCVFAECEKQGVLICVLAMERVLKKKKKPFHANDIFFFCVGGVCNFVSGVESGKSFYKPYANVYLYAYLKNV